MFDFSWHSENFKFYEGAKKNVIGKIKDVAKVVSIVEYGEL